jgi:hypothetical protein
MKRFLVCVLYSVFLLSLPSSAESAEENVFRLLQGFPDNTLVPDENAALGVVEALIRGKYGEETLKQNQPMTVRRDGEFWIVEGKEKKPFAPSTVRISRVDAHVDQFMVSAFSEHPLVPQPQSMSKDDCHASCHMLQEKK